MIYLEDITLEHLWLGLGCERETNQGWLQEFWTEQLEGWNHHELKWKRMRKQQVYNGKMGDQEFGCGLKKG